MKKIHLIISLLFIGNTAICQSIDESIEAIELKKADLETQIKDLELKLIDLNLAKIIIDLKKIGLPSKRFIEHSGFILEYSEEHEQAKWTTHIILPEIKNGKAKRTNDFRTDPKIPTGTTDYSDYYRIDTLATGKVEYIGSHLDRGHLVPSADFKWSQKATSETFYYSNMSPQDSTLNRGKWAELERFLRKYVISNGIPLYIVTLPILEDKLPKIKESINGLSVPKKFAKAAYDPINKRTIGFIMDNKESSKPLKSYTVTVDEIEQVSGLNIFANVPENIEASYVEEDWFDNFQLKDKKPIDIKLLPKNTFNTLQAQSKVGLEICVCGHVVETNFARNGHLRMNLDKSFPDHYFTIFLRKDYLDNFDSDPSLLYKNELICVKGKVDIYKGKINMYPKNQKDISLFNKKN